ncbi:MAG TPA: hypothetical protein VGN56_00155 [Candidatus Paceibacterota bacterium]|jgi:regulator of protease activity HflC (stomatin/prohibitin superfamily)|nr:hypothetical protein [Candidatus Paceibacterota bacterium]
MLIQLLLGTTAALGTAVIGIIVSLPWVMTSLARRQVLVAFCKEGTIKSVVRGEAFSHQFMNWKGWHLNDPRKPWFEKDKPRWQVLPHDDHEDDKYDDRPDYMKTAGVHWIGWPPFGHTYWYRFSWSELRDDGHGGDEVWNRKGKDGKGELTDFAFAKAFTYARVLRKVEIADGFAVDLLYVVTVRIENAYSALFRAEDWLKIMFASSDREARDFAGARHFQELLTEKRDLKDKKPDDEPSNFSLPIVALTNALHDDNPDAKDCGLLARYGVRIVSADLTDFDPIGERVLEANSEAYVQQQRARGIEAVGQAEADVIEMKGGKEAEVIRLKGKAVADALQSRLAVLKDAGKIGELLLQTDAMIADGPGKRVIWANNPFIRDNGLSDLLDGVGLTPQELKDALTRFVQQEREVVVA